MMTTDYLPVPFIGSLGGGWRAIGWVLTVHWEEKLGWAFSHAWELEMLGEGELGWGSFAG